MGPTIGPAWPGRLRGALLQEGIMSCDLCGTETSPGESICWHCTEAISRNTCARCALGDRADGHDLCEDCLGEVQRTRWAVIDERHSDAIADYARDLVSGAAVAGFHLHGIPDAALSADDRARTAEEEASRLRATIRRGHSPSCIWTGDSSFCGYCAELEDK